MMWPQEEIKKVGVRLHFFKFQFTTYYYGPWFLVLYLNTESNKNSPCLINEESSSVDLSMLLSLLSVFV